MQHRIAPRDDRLHHIGDGRQRLGFDLDESGCILGEITAIGDHQRHRLDQAHLAECDQRCSTGGLARQGSGPVSRAARRQ